MGEADSSQDQRNDTHEEWLAATVTARGGLLCFRHGDPSVHFRRRFVRAILARVRPAAASPCRPEVIPEASPKAHLE
ncbi:hypothetical protein MKUB_54290 [Mycobacterium kubicae]|uniref:DUF222 domain-containing protein n=1 Tax=Mycobacterium kubicae TaxID=120959 RepID=A0ABQ1BWZ7_9MYCO|nr:hypothetical protein MKUB_54290 [Mycobacterium kubicae]